MSFRSRELSATAIFKTMLYELRDATLTVGSTEVLSHANFQIKQHEKVGLIGANGVGKTTLLRLIAGELSLDRDDRRDGSGIYVSRKITVGYLKQSYPDKTNKTARELLMEHCPAKGTYEKERYLYETEANRLFTGLGFCKDDRNKAFGSFSGGEQTKIMLIDALLQKPDLLLLDEPTNHLDIESVVWLERYMKSYEGAVIFVSHDRYFLDRTVGTIYELSNRRLIRFTGNYSDYRKEKSRQAEQAKKAYAIFEEKVKKEEALIEKFKHNPTKASFVRARKSALARMERPPIPSEDTAHGFCAPIEPSILGPKCVYEAKDLKIGYQKLSDLQNESVPKEEIEPITLRIRRGQKIGIIGANGAGKTTFLKTVAGMMEPLYGSSVMGERVLMGYFDQQSASFLSEKTVFSHFREQFGTLSDKEVRSILGSYLFCGADASKQISVLSGGEKARLFLAEILTSAPNFLVLDEPTNHMDIPAKETLESAFSAYTGTMLFVSHDRYFLKEIADALLIFEDHHVSYYPFGYEHYVTHVLESDGESITAVTDAKNQAMLAGLKAVPKPERHRLREIGTEEAYADWKLRLVEEPMLEAMECASEAYKNREKEWLQELETALRSYASETKSDMIGSNPDAGGDKALEDTKPDASGLLEQALDAWTKYCLDWYDVWIELHEF